MRRSRTETPPATFKQGFLASASWRVHHHHPAQGVPDRALLARPPTGLSYIRFQLGEIWLGLNGHICQELLPVLPLGGEDGAFVLNQGLGSLHQGLLWLRRGSQPGSGLPGLLGCLQDAGDFQANSQNPACPFIKRNLWEAGVSSLRTGWGGAGPY